MRFFTTPGQRRILRYYWAHQAPFSVEELVASNTARCQSLIRFSLWRMTRKGQVLLQNETKQLYIGTTDSMEEWKHLKKEKLAARLYGPGFGAGMEGMNSYEADEWAEEALEIIEAKKAELRARKQAAENGVPSAEKEKK